MERKQGKEAPATKILSVRLPVKEAEQVDVMAKASGLNRNEYIRLRLKESTTFADAGRLDEVIGSLRHLERQQEGHLERLDDLLTLVRSSGWAEDDISALQRLIEKGELLMEELFKAQRRAVRVIEGTRSKVNRG